MFRATNSPILRSSFWLYIQFLVQCTDTAADRQQCRCIVPKAVYTVKKSSWGWANLSPETRRAELKRLINEKVVASCWFLTSYTLLYYTYIFHRKLSIKISWSRALIKYLIVSQIIKKFPITFRYPERNQSDPGPQNYFLNIHFNIILPSMRRSLSSTFPHQNHVCPSSFPHKCHMPWPYYFSFCDHSNNIWQRARTIKLS